MLSVQTSQQAHGRYSDTSFGRDDNYPWRVVVRGQFPNGTWITLEVFEWSNEAGAHVVGTDSALDYADSAAGYIDVHYYVGEVA